MEEIMSESKNIFALRLSPQARRIVAQLYSLDNCRSQNEFIEKAVHFYAGHLQARNYSKFLAPALTSTIRGTLDDSENRIARLLFKLAVEVSMMTHVLASGLEISDDELNRLRGRCVAEVKRTNGRISFEDAVKSAQGL